MHATDDPKSYDRIAPHSIEAEQCLIGSLLLCDGDASIFAEVRAAITSESFFQADHSIIFDAITKMHDAKAKIDAVTLSTALSSRGMLEEIGGNEYIVRLFNNVPSFNHAGHYAKIVSSKSRWRELIRIGNAAIKEAYAPREDDALSDIDGVIADISSKLARVATDGKMNEVHLLADVIPEVIAYRGDNKRRCSTKINSLDNRIHGLTFGEKTIIGGKPSMGKSALIKRLARNIAEEIPVGIISIEEKRQKIATNLLSGESRVPNNRIEFGTAGPEEWGDVQNAIEQLSQLPIYLVDSARKLSTIVAMANVLVSRYGCRAIFVDHLHIIDGQPQKNDNRNIEISKISAELKWVWKDLGVIGVEAAQLNRAGGRERPELASLRDSGSLEADADTVILLHREDYYRRSEPGFQPDNILELLLLKNKHGATANIPLHYDEARYDIRDREEYP